MNGVGARFRAVFVSLILVLGLIGPARAEGLEPLQIVTASGTHDFKVEIAADDASRERGLMNRRFMPADHGMLFEFQQNAPVAFWMKNTYIPLDMIFLSPAGAVTHIARERRAAFGARHSLGSALRRGARGQRRRRRRRSGSRSATGCGTRFSSPEVRRVHNRRKPQTAGAHCIGWQACYSRRRIQPADGLWPSRAF